MLIVQIVLWSLAVVVIQWGATRCERRRCVRIALRLADDAHAKSMVFGLMYDGSGVCDAEEEEEAYREVAYEIDGE